MPVLKVAICGGSGYAGAELLRILAGHLRVEVTAVTSEKSAGLSPSDLYGHLHAYSALKFEPLKKKNLLDKADFFFMSLPHGASQDAVNYFVGTGKKVVDLSADFRIRNHLVYEQWYKTRHRFVTTLKKAVYGLPELHRKEIKNTSLVANPGCYPTAAILGLYPVLKENLIDTNTIVIDAKSGTSGAGRKSDAAYSFCEVNESLRAYGVISHRHTPEIEQELNRISKKPFSVSFTPHLIPINRGVLCTIYARTRKRADTEMLYSLYARAYGKEPFVRVLNPDRFPDVKNVRGTNFCEIGLAYNERTSTIIIVSAIDNLVKGAAGQAVQCMNIMMGFGETTALSAPALNP